MASRGPPHLEKWEAVALQLEGLEIGGDWPDAMGAAPAPDCLRIPVDFEIHIMLRSCSRTATPLEGCIDRVGRRGCRALLPEPARLVFPRRHLRGERGRHGTGVLGLHHWRLRVARLLAELQKDRRLEGLVYVDVQHGGEPLRRSGNLLDLGFAGSGRSHPEPVR